MRKNGVRTGTLELLAEESKDTLTNPRRAFVDEGSLGSGVTGDVRQIYDPRLLRRSALKRVQRGTTHPRQVSRFLSEARVTGRLEHPNIVPVHEFGIDGDGGMYLTMKLVDGTSLAEHIDDKGQARLKPEAISEVIAVLVRICDAVSYAHSEGVIHCDVKPENILISDYGAVYLVDWGAAHVLAPDGGPRPVDEESDHISAGQPVGTPAYLSPEQARGDRDLIGPTTDVYGLCAALYYALAGEPPHGTGNVPQTVHRAAMGQVPPLAVPGVPVLLTRIIMRGLDQDPSRRHGDVATLKRELELFQRGTWHLPIRNFDPGTLIIKEGDQAQQAWVINAGRCVAWTERNGERMDIREMGPGDVFGELGIVTNSLRSANVEALTEVELYEVGRATLEEGLGLNSWLGTFVRTLASRFQAADSRLRDRHFSQTPDADR